MTPSTADPDGAPVISVVRGNPTPEEIAAVVLVLTAGRAEEAATRSPSPTGQWAAYWRSLRTPIAPGPGSWRQSGRTQ
ncbi:acyl-CoA carboxylase subunit epsilon [Microlunatus ginsengisoli]|uniref:Acyl-CoA carboxylase subunit epsilon n=1 Tax=Microlunatus ginsengisoli TaxID=363863 RepID=A0ABP6ZEU1_9ACTN